MLFLKKVLQNLDNHVQNIVLFFYTCIKVHEKNMSGFIVAGENLICYKGHKKQSKN